MTQTAKRILFALFVSSLLLMTALPVSATEKAEPPILSVSGEGSAEAVPDQAVITIGITTHSADAQDARNKNAATAADIQQALRELGINNKDIQTRDYNFRPTYHQANDNSNEINGYTVNNSVIVTLRDISLIGNAIDTALRHGANQISALSLGVQDPRRLRKDALQTAVRDARDKADIIAGSLGRRIIGIKNVSESTGSANSRHYEMAILSKSVNSAVDTPIESGTVSLSATVHIDFILND